MSTKRKRVPLPTVADEPRDYETQVNTFLEATRAGLPEKLEELIPLSFMGHAAVRLYRTKVKLIDQLGLAEAQKKITLRDGQDASDMLLDITTRIGELSLAVQPVASLPHFDDSGRVRGSSPRGAAPKHQRLGLSSRKAMANAQAIYRHPEAVAEVKAEAREREDIASVRAVLARIARARPHQRAVAIVVPAPASPMRAGARGAGEDLYLDVLDQILEVLPPRPPQHWSEKGMKSALDKVAIIRKRLRAFEDGVS